MPALPTAQIAPVKPNNPLSFTREEWDKLTMARLAEDLKKRYPRGYDYGYGRGPTFALKNGEKATPKL